MTSVCNTTITNTEKNRPDSVQGLSGLLLPGVAFYLLYQVGRGTGIMSGYSDWLSTIRLVWALSLTGCLLLLQNLSQELMYFLIVGFQFQSDFMRARFKTIESVLLSIEKKHLSKRFLNYYYIKH